MTDRDAIHGILASIPVGAQRGVSAPESTGSFGAGLHGELIEPRLSSGELGDAHIEEERLRTCLGSLIELPGLIGVRVLE